MGLFDTIARKVQSDLEYKAASTITGGIEGGLKRGIPKKGDVKKCPKCKAPITDANLKFCPECGSNLYVACPKCNIDLNLSTKFCPQCGSKPVEKREDTAKKAEVEAPKCYKCKKAIPEAGLKYCPSCGANFMVTCVKCNVDFPLGTKFCPKCGEKPVAKPQEAGEKCPKCKAIITDPNLKFCADCGAKIKATCATCNLILPINKKFCPQCGGKLSG